MGALAAGRCLPPAPPTPAGAAHLLAPPPRRQRRCHRPCRRAASHVRAALPSTLLGAAARSAASGAGIASTAASGLAAAIDPGVLAATMAASGKLLIICGAVGYLLRSGRIPNSTATVMSQVSFQLLIPCMLFSKVSSTLAANPDPTLLLGIAAMALFQIAVGAATGLLLTPLLAPRGEAAEQQRQQQQQGWRGSTSPGAASAIALSLAAASGAPQAAAALRPKQEAAKGATTQMVAAGAAFGNSFTLPAVFLTTLLPAPLASRALGYAALFLLAWSPCLWSIGMALIGGTPAQQRQQQRAASRAAAAAQELQQLQEQQPSGQQEGVQTAGSSSGPKPLTWRQPRAVDVTPLSSSGGSLGSGDGAGAGEVPTWAEQLAQHPAVAWLSQFAAQVLNPPVLAILAGMLVGLTPAGRALLTAMQSGGAAAAGSAAAAVAAAGAALPPELGLLHAVAKAALEVIELLADGTLASQTLVLAASLMQQPESPASAVAAAPVGPAVAASAAAATSLQRRGWVGALRTLLPADATEARAIAVMMAARSLVVPLFTIGALQALAAGGLLPPALSDPVLLFVLLVEAVMPSAQNLLILLQISERTQALAPAFARTLLKQYFYAILPVTLWVTCFATNLAIPVLR